MTNLQVFSNGADFVIAESIDDAVGLLPYLGTDDVFPDEWGPEPMDGKFSIWLDHDGEVSEHHVGDLIERTWAEWIESFGKGYLCTTEY